MITKIKNKIQKYLSSYEQEIELCAPKEAAAQFDLVYKKIRIGELTLNNGVWTFAYTPEFKEQNILSPIVDFPDKSKIYQQNTLFPYFASRIPSLQRLKVQNLIAPDVETDVVTLLERFGQMVITNPFRLIAQ